MQHPTNFFNLHNTSHILSTNRVYLDPDSVSAWSSKLDRIHLIGFSILLQQWWNQSCGGEVITGISRRFGNGEIEIDTGWMTWSGYVRDNWKYTKLFAISCWWKNLQAWGGKFSPSQIRKMYWEHTKLRNLAKCNLQINKQMWWGGEDSWPTTKFLKFRTRWNEVWCAAISAFHFGFFQFASYLSQINLNSNRICEEHWNQEDYTCQTLLRLFSL